ncbi:phosphoribosyltransferase [Motilimonas eburnea]|uniref:phosphoribosyltransferase n=1 Tax=Motilimonas eburnea TaxID=1737488 RepID=UPI001E49ACDF|nr:phosphoribosyltransferase family protein [Motilimonas eburnea]MCE2572885.1 hypoxanthine phosphoribosyltransferase [Motilimonas eburnea]
MKEQYIGDLVFNEKDIAHGVNLVASKLNSVFAEKELVVITVVPGGMLFCADLVRALTPDIKMDYISCPHTPGDKTNDSEIIYHQNIPIKGENVLLVDDAIESGGTMKRLASHIYDNFNPLSLSIATLLVKPGRVHIPFEQFYGYRMEEDELLVGYGLPWKDKLRNTPFISKLNLGN